MADLGKKLQLKKEHAILLLMAPEDVAQALQQEGYTFIRADEAPSVGSYGAVLLFVQQASELEQLAPQAVALLQPEGLLWVAYPKKSSGIKTDLTRDNGWQVMGSMQYEPVRQVAVDEVWSALRFRPQAARKQPSTFGVDMPGIDRKTKTVTVPDDLKEALQEAGLLEAFESMAFTHRKEYVVAVLEAKRPETRARRIAKTVEAMANRKV
ncbi:bacteriocin resistance YdeI/OmpD-like protein [Pontibacter mucosus]|uniref:Bacteriocin resistance YdeI/OmpD-like protein n=1 Tax=Pontibacter mucosus TaxID=1649266 RepID=A0A2T5YTE5_9BACT|nr:YdeI/OmpD-associated family protein [Pontibacter mucosus]PTX22583.1 bacteriocin resistance YdeI/OmpD-like protein [Pontibacter mucosus]